MDQRNNRTLEALLAKGVAQAMPDLLNGAASAPLPAAEILSELLPKQEKKPSAHPLRRALAACACFLVICGGLASYFHPAARIGIDVNPSIALTTNLYDRVLTAAANNEDAEIVLSDLKLRGVDLDTAISAIIGSMVQHDYLYGEGSTVRISVRAGSDRRVIQLEQRVSEDVRNALPDEQSNVAVFTKPSEQQDNPKPAESALDPDSATAGQTVSPSPEDSQVPSEQAPPISPTPSEPDASEPQTKPQTEPQGNGKAAMIAYLLTLDPTLNPDTFQRWSVKDLRELAEDLEDELEDADDDEDEDDEEDSDYDDDEGNEDEKDDHDRDGD